MFYFKLYKVKFFRLSILSDEREARYQVVKSIVDWTASRHDFFICFLFSVHVVPWFVYPGMRARYVSEVGGIGQSLPLREPLRALGKGTDTF